MFIRRFWCADKFDVEKAYQRYTAACQMRDAVQLLQAYENIEVEEFEKARVLVSGNLPLSKRVDG